jgi:hypothetical protein
MSITEALSATLMKHKAAKLGQKNDSALVVLNKLSFSTQLNMPE